MLRPSFFAIAAASLLGGPAVVAQEVANDNASLRAAIESQTRRIDSLAEQIERLAKLIEPRGEMPAATPLPPASAAPEESSPAPAPEPTPAGPKHVVKKGENLTAIAKQYGVMVDVLAAANRIEDARKLQIGQVLVIPEPAPENIPKENP